MNNLTPEKLAELRRLLDAGTPRPWMACEDDDEVLIVLDDDSNHWPGRYAAIARGFEQGDDYGLSDAMLVTAAVNALPALLDAAADRAALAEWRDFSVAELEALRATLEGRCLSDITHRDEEHRQSVCMLPEGHAPLMHDDCMGCTWTDADHWQQSAVDRADELEAAIERVRALHQACMCEVCGEDPSCEACDSMTYPCATIRALDESEADRD